MKSNWQTLKTKSTYHFDPTQKDLPTDVMHYLGHIEPTWQQDLPDIIDNARPATWATRGYKGEHIPPPTEDLIAEEYDIERVGADPKMTITHLNWAIPDSLKEITRL